MKRVAPHLGDGVSAHGRHLGALGWVTAAGVTGCEWEKCELRKSPKPPASVLAPKWVMLKRKITIMKFA